MSDGRTPDFAKHLEDLRAELLASGRSREQLLDEAREILRETRLALPTYKQAQDEMRYTLAVEDLEELEDMYRELAKDSAGIFELDDYVELRATSTPERDKNSAQHNYPTTSTRTTLTHPGCNQP